MNTRVLTGHEQDIASIQSDAQEWESSIEDQLSHIVYLVNDELDRLKPNSVDIFGEPIDSKNVSELTLKAIEACIARIRKLQK